MATSAHSSPLSSRSPERSRACCSFSVVRTPKTTGKADAVIALGAVIRGETTHYETVAGECAAGIQRAQLATGVPIVFGVLTTDTVDQARERLDKGAEFAAAAVEMATLLRTIS